MKIFKRLTIAIVALIAIVIAGLGILLMTLDANLLKPVLQKLALEHSAELEIPGDISWQFYPNLGLSLGALRVKTTADPQPLVSIEGASVSVKLMPLLKDRAILVNGITLDGLNAVYSVRADGTSAWDTLGSSDATPPEPDPAAPGDLPTLEIDSIDIRNLHVQYSNAQNGDNVVVSDTHLSSKNFSLTGQPFDLSLQSTIEYNQQPKAELSWQGSLAVDWNKQTVSTDSAKISARLDRAQVNISLTNQSRWSDPISSEGHLTLHATPIQPLFKALKISAPKTNSPEVLQNVSAELDYKANTEQVQMTNASILLDRIQLQGDLSIHNFTKPQIKTHWQGNSVALDDYLPPTDTTPAAGTAPAKKPSATEQAPQPLPVEALQALDLEASIGFEKIQTHGLDLLQPQLKVQAKNGLLQLQKLALKVAEGDVAGSGRLDARQANTQLKLDLTTQNVNLGTLLKTFAELDKINGHASAKVNITSNGATDQALMDNLKVQADAQSKNLSLVPINLEQQFCKAIALLQQSAPKNFDWPAMTELEPVTMHMTFSEQTLKLDQLQAEIAHLAGDAQGQFNLLSGEFNFPFNLSLANFAAEIPGCLPIKEKWRKRALPLRCKGNIDDIGVTTCLPDTKLIGDMLGDKIKEEAKAKLDEKKAEAQRKLEKKQDELEKKAGDKTKEAIQRELGEEKTEELENTLKNALDKLRGKN